MRTRILLVIVLLLAPTCAKAPPQLPAGDVILFQSRQAVVAIGTVQHAAIELNKIQVCPPAPCRPLLSDDNTRIVIDTVASGVTAIRAVPTGWRATTTTALTQISTRLDAAGKTTIAGYVQAANTILAGLK